MKLTAPVFVPFILSLTFTVSAQVNAGNKPVQNQNKAEPLKSSVSKYEPDFFLVTDSVLGNWKKTGKYFELRKNDRENATCADAAGNIYAIGNNNIDGYYFEHIYRFMNGAWQVFDPDKSGEILKIMADANGTVYAVTANKIFQASENNWTELVAGTFTKYNVFAGHDGCIYFTEPVYEKKLYVGSKLFRVKNAKPVLILDNNQPLIVTGDLQADRNGNIYQYSAKQSGIKIWNGKEWNITEAISLPVNRFWVFDKNNTLYTSGVSVGKNMFIKVLNGLSWNTLTIPDSLDTEVHDWQLFADTKGEIYLKADKEFEEARVYRIHSNRFELICKQTKRQATGQKITKCFPAGNTFTMLQEDRKFTVDYGWKDVVEPVYYAPVWDIKIRKMAHIPNYEIVSEPYIKEYRNLNKCYLFEHNGKYGMQTKAGHIIAEPVFDKIYVYYTPSHLLEKKEGEFLQIGNFFCFTLIQGNDTLFSHIGSYDFELPRPGMLEMFKFRETATCSYCNGKGVIEAHKETITVKGKWIPPVTSSFTSTSYEKRWDGIVGGYVTYIVTKTSNQVTSGGGYEPDTQQTIHVPEHKCERCEGRPVKRSYQVYRFNRSQMKYYETWD